MSRTEFDLREHLADEAQHIDARGDFAIAVLEAKRRSDRRRAVIGGIAAAAVLAVAAPLAASTLRSAPPVLPATSSTPPETPTSQPTTSGAPTPAPTVTAMTKDARVTAQPELSDAGTYGDPGVPHSVKGVVHEGGSTVEAPVKAGFPTFARLDHGGYVLGATSGADQKIYIVSADGKASVLEGARGFVVSADRSRIAWTDGRAVNHPGEGLIHIADSSGKELSTVKVDGFPTALVGDALFVIKQLGFDFAGESLRVDLATGTQTPIEGNVYAVHAATGVAISADNLPPESVPGRPDSCYRILDVTSSPPATRLRACGDFLPTSFSPDGRFVFGRGAEERIVVVDAATGRIVLDALGDSGLHPEAARMTDDGRAIVMSVTKDWTHNALIRCDLSGQCSQVAGPAVEDPAQDDIDTPRTAYGISAN